ncbi:hypothetical protein CCACVL1_28298 [Corchorus capsularis]|uniref:EF-hand domain-containing protein n=1 Tax=Corchorus capsularis TaxID=210143 RepID=A0A1R3G6V9_COCAP|nr:hypothetical protein CCACVL1_28298 [Corchorus capsularis]
MDEVRKIAEAYYLAGPDEVRNAAHEFFDKMDEDKDEYISQEEFATFLEQLGDKKLETSPVFWLLDSMGDEKLNFMDIMALYYLIKSGRPFCNGANCGELITGVYFSCIECFYNSKGFCICTECFKKKNHDQSHRFLDNFTLLECVRQTALEKPGSCQIQRQVSSRFMINNVPNNEENAASCSTLEPTRRRPSSALALNPESKKKKMEKIINKKSAIIAFEVFDKLVSYGLMAAQLASCNIM